MGLDCDVGGLETERCGEGGCVDGIHHDYKMVCLFCFVYGQVVDTRGR